MSALLVRTGLIVPLIVASAFFMENLDGTVIATALPQMARSFGVGPVSLSIGMTAYLLTVAVFIPMSGWIADRLGARSVFGGAILLFTFASVLCGISTGLWPFTAARVLQGVGGAMMVPVGRMVVLRSTDKAGLMRAMSTITWPGLVAPVLGPPLGGFITTYSSWRWIFFLNLPLGLLGIALVARFVTNFRTDTPRPFDWSGFVLTGGGLAALIYGLDVVGRPGADLAQAGLVLALGAILGVLAVRHIRRAAHPIVDPAAAKFQTYAFNLWSGSLFRIAISTLPFLVPLLLQVAFGMTAFAAGLLVLVGAAGNLGMKAITTPVLRRFGFRQVLLFNGSISAMSILACAALTPQTPHWAVALVLLIGGLARSMQFTALNTVSFVDVPTPLMSGASTLASMFVQLTMGMGVAFGAIGLHVSAMLRGGGGPPSLRDFQMTFVAAALLGVASVWGARRLPQDAGAQVSGHRVRA